MRVWVEVKPYRRKFLTPLNTSHGPWQWREGLLLSLKDRAGRVGLGEVAPIPWFGTEVLDDAWSFWRGKQGWLAAEDLWMVPDALPASQFGAGSALEGFKGNSTVPKGAEGLQVNHADLCSLLPAGADALKTAHRLFMRGHRTFKWKIGIYPIDLELAWFNALVACLPEGCRLRLDANGGLALPQARAWLEHCDAFGASLPSSSDTAGQEGKIEYIEQPLPPHEIAAMVLLGERFSTPIALDESVATVGQMEACNRNQWPGLFVVKPAIAGFPQRLRSLLKKVGTRVTFSSAFETVIGRRTALRIALDHNQQHFPSGAVPALGFGSLGYFADDWDNLTPEQLWERI